MWLHAAILNRNKMIADAIQKLMMFQLILLPLFFLHVTCYKSILILRHGARDPDVWTEYDTQYLWTDPITILTQKGVDQLIKVGKQQQRAEIFDNQGRCIYEKLELQSSKTARCTSSMVCFIKGLCPNNYAEILHTFFQNYYSNLVQNQKKFNNILQSDFSDPLELDYDIFDKSGDFMFQGHKTAQCPNLKQVNKNVEKSSSYLQQEASFKNMDALNGVYDIMVKGYPSKIIKKGSITLTDIDDIYDDTFCNQFQGFHFPDPSQQIFEYMSEVVKFLKYFGKNSEMFQHQAALSESFKWIVSQLYSQDPFSLYVGTESNQFAMLAVLTDDRTLTPFASQLEFIVKGDIVYIYFNKVQVKSKACENGYYCSIANTVQYLLNFTVRDIKTFCGA